MLSQRLSTEAEQALVAIERRVALLIAESREVVTAFFNGVELPLEVDAQATESGLECDPPTSRAIGNYAPFWRSLVPADFRQRAELCYLLGRRYHVDPTNLAVRAALQIDHPELIASTRNEFGVDPEALLLPETEIASDERRPLHPEDPMYAVAEDLEWILLAKDVRLFSQGDPGDALYVIVSGAMAVMSESASAAPRLLVTLKRGELVGEMAVITGRERSATVVAAEDSRLVRLSKSSFDSLLERHPRAMIPLLRLLVNRLEQRQERLVKQVAELTIQIDESRRLRDVSQIVDSEFFNDLREKADKMRARRPGRQS